MPKKVYRVRNWSQYNKALEERGSITYYFDQKIFNNWYDPEVVTNNRGRPRKYSNRAIQLILVLKHLYRTNLRFIVGFVKSLFKLAGIDLEVPSYTQLCRRQKTVKLPSLPVSSTSIHFVGDSSGLKVFGEGEWKVRQHGYSKRRTWRKLHIGVNEEKRLIVSAMLTENNCGDDKQLPILLNEYKGKIHQVSLDGAYDSHACHDEIALRGAIGTIPTQDNPKHKPKTKDQIQRPRDKVVWEIQQKGRAEWKKESGYHRRSLAENAFYRFKQITGDKLSSRKLENQKVEVLIRCHIINKMTQLGMPVSVLANK